jgi:hypothetical protein
MRRICEMSDHLSINHLAFTAVSFSDRLRT